MIHWKPLRAEHLGGQSKKTEGTLELRYDSKSVHEPLMLLEVLISQLREKVNMKQN